MAKAEKTEAQDAGRDGRPPGHDVMLVMITGHSGAGKSEAIAAFEDGGYFCVDNLPPRMIGSLGELFRHEGSGVERAAVVSDVRGGEYFDDLLQVLDELEADGLRPKVLFLEADEETLVDRYKETRRRHPLAPEGRRAFWPRSSRQRIRRPTSARASRSSRSASRTCCVSWRRGTPRPRSARSCSSARKPSIRTSSGSRRSSGSLTGPITFSWR